MSSPARRSGRTSRSSTQSSRQEDMDTSSELAAPLPSPPASAMLPPPTPSDQPRGGPGSVLVSEIDLSSPMNYGTPSSVGSSLRTPRTGSKETPIR